ncbi:alpha/beta fold hydrolase [Limimaricola pyoseonensis]|uniref:Pimeloyl-ACP methyl ester carboxylesterase n=1 Tax=Limimaricola pyoseonensis TaxID=521013 RepID=A0A1G7JGV1_9RHOB|nr:alpha/beta hydrolase [Limimaricola pyoseonensis]SDF24146.1 Pimeloyl-ACP methyl ester carboxylesterase [Limimaricola pyoseonensis]
MIVERNNVVTSGRADGRPIVFAHGFGCDQSMWRQVAPAFEDRHHVVTYDLTGMGGSDLAAYDMDRYADLEAHAADLNAILEELDLEDAVLVGHSIGATIALLAAEMAPNRVSQLALVSPTPCFLEDDGGDYHGGFRREDLEELVHFLDENHLGWSAQMAPTIAGQSAGEPAAEELTQSFCRTDPAIAQHFGRVTFFADRRAEFARVAQPVLILHCDQDALVPMRVAEWMRDRVPRNRLEVLNATGHCPHMTVPSDVVAAMRDFVGPG